MVRFFWRISFLALATSVFAGERLNALVTAAQDFSVAIQQQLAAVQGMLAGSVGRCWLFESQLLFIYQSLLFTWLL
jgi:hypothetical protein